MNKSIKLLIIYVIGIITGISIIVSYATTYNSESISYDNSISHASATNVKDAIDFLYNHGLGLCPEDMTCIESPIVTINVEGPGSVDKESMHVRINGSNKFTVSPNENFTLNSISCDNGYTLSDFKTLSKEAMSPQEITVNNPNINEGSICNVKFSANEISIESSYNLGYNGTDLCNEGKEGCICWYIKNGGSKFSYGSHIGCSFKSKTCKNTSNPITNGATLDCEKIAYFSNWRGVNGMGQSDDVSCSGVITCET